MNVLIIDVKQMSISWSSIAKMSITLMGPMRCSLVWIIVIRINVIWTVEKMNEFFSFRYRNKGNLRRGPQSAFARLFPDRYRQEEFHRLSRLHSSDEQRRSVQSISNPRTELEPKGKFLTSVELFTDFPRRSNELRTMIIYCHCSCQHGCVNRRRVEISSSPLNHYDVPRVSYDEQCSQWKVAEPTVR